MEEKKDAAMHEAIAGVMRDNKAIQDTLFKAMDDLLAHKINSEDANKICNDASIKLKAINEEFKAVFNG